MHAFERDGIINLAGDDDGDYDDEADVDEEIPQTDAASWEDAKWTEQVVNNKANDPFICDLVH